MRTSPLPCPDCGRAAHLLISDRTVATADHRVPRKRVVRLACPTGCVPSEPQLERLADPMAC